MSSPEAVQHLREQLDAWMDREKLRGDARFIDQQAWEVDRREEFGRGAAVTLLIDGSPLNAILNYGNRQVEDEFVAIVGGCGFFYEMSYAWAVHFHPLGTSGLFLLDDHVELTVQPAQ